MKVIEHCSRAALTLLIILAGSPIATAETADLRGYGKVTAAISPEHTEFVCSSDAKADILLGKLLADLFWDAGNDHVEKTATIEGKEVLVHLWAPYGALIAGRDGNTVLVAGGLDEQAALAAARKDRRFLSKSFQFKPSRPYPMYLDFYDLRAWKSATEGLDGRNKYDNDARMQFVKAYCDGGLMGWLLFRGAAPVGDSYSSAVDTDFNIAEKAHQMYSISVSTGVWPGWAQNRWPQMVEVDSAEDPGGIDYTNYGGPVQALGIPPAIQYQSNLKFLGDLMERYKNRDAFGGLELYCGDYICETAFQKSGHGHLGYTAVGEQAFRRWLRETRKFSLTDLGERWYGDPGHYKDWNEVQLPADINGFFGDLNDQCLRINKDWYWMQADKGLDEMPQDSTPGWLPAGDVPSRMAIIANSQSKPAFWRVSFDAAGWLKKNGGKDVWLVCNLNNQGWHAYNVWLNGKAMGKIKSTVSPFEGPISLKVTGLLANGVNRLTLSSPAGHIWGPVFLTTTEPKPYPYLGIHQNARYVDMVEWQSHAFNALVIDTMEYARGIDPDRPFVIDATSVEVKDAQGEALSRLGGSMHDTGYEASYRPHDSRMGYAGGFYGSCEPSGYIPTKVPGNWPETEMLSNMLFNGEGHFRMTGDSYYFYDIEKQSHWLENNRRAIDLVGKTLPEKPDIAIYVSSQNSILGDGFRDMAEWDIGRGELAACHYDNVYVTESMLAKGLADDYPVLIDTNTQIMGPDTIDAIRKYVEKGGTFVALHQSGRHGILEPDTWPISELTGFKVLSTAKKGKITFEKNLPIFKGWEGRQFAGEGTALDFKNDEAAKDVSAALLATASNAIPLARWDDGTTAVGMRTLGKGRVIALGSTFWRYGRDLGGNGYWRTQDLEQEFMERLFTDLGIKRSATASDKRVYARKMISKNGLQDWLIVINTTKGAIKADAGFAVAQKPAEVRDLVDREPVPFEFQNGWVTLKDVAITPFGRRIFAVQRAQLSAGLDFWWMEKTKFWKSPELKPITVAPETDKANPPMILFDGWKFHPDMDNSVSKTADWTGTAFADSAWRNLNNDPWNYQYDDLKTYSGVGLYRHLFTIPAAWKNRKVTVNIYTPQPGCFTAIELYVNGEAIAGAGGYRRHKFDITGKLKKGSNVVAIKLTGTRPLSGLLGCDVLVQPEMTLNPCVSLLGEWDAFKVDSTQPEKAIIEEVDPALTYEGHLFNKNHRGFENERTVLANHQAVEAYRLAREVDVPAAWAGKNVYIRLNSPQMENQTPQLRGLGRGMVMINNEPIAFKVGPNSPIENEMINVTPFIKFGQKNRIDILPDNALNGSNQDALLVINNMDLGLGCGAK